MVKVSITGVTPVNGTGYLIDSNPPDRTQNEMIVDCILTLSGNYGGGATHGDAISFTSLWSTVAQLAIGMPFSFGDQPPSFWSIQELLVAGAAPLGYQYNYNPGPTLAAPTQNGGVLTIVGTGAASGQGGTEITEGSAYSGFTPSLNGAQLKARFWFPRL